MISAAASADAPGCGGERIGDRVAAGSSRFDAGGAELAADVFCPGVGGELFEGVKSVGELLAGV